MPRPALLAVILLLLPCRAALAQPCPEAPPGAPDRRYLNSRFGFGFAYPPIFALDPDSVPEAGDSARFWTADRRATAVVNAAPNGRRLGLRALMADAEGDVLHNARGRITYRRIRDTWFVISGHMAGRIFYRRTLLLRDGRIATLWMEFPTAMRACLDAAVTRMSLSFRETPIPSPSP